MINSMGEGMISERKLTDPRIIVALDFPEAEQALSLADVLDPKLCRVKVGFELYVASGASLVSALHDRGFDVFLDLKFHDIPNTVASACRAAAKLGVWMLNVHASGGRSMLLAAREAVHAFEHPPLLIGVTVLTSMDETDLQQIGICKTATEQVLELAHLTYECGLDGVVCSAQEAAALRESIGSEFTLVTPGIRPMGSAAGDQKRTLTPSEAVGLGADYLVIGRPITRSTDPLGTLHEVVASLATSSVA
ncbi:orotidine 5'-phosphate decarboxylase [Acidihalobacter aeolianus]|uniref:Orotidine 5'-phosphate decarboxylase n=2 Tax=Acidihalobacter aeolianus TaxID=2792603 RepID=A0A1D8K8C7_9GAMM|nr:orotidine 5'-phosphate decarboxylase [Acidihalobacter aeolianus]